MRITSHFAKALVVAGTGLLVAVSHAQVPDAAKDAAKPSAGAAPKAEDPRKVPVRDLMRAFAKAYDAADSKALASLFVADASIVDPTGTETQGQPAIAAMYAESHRAAPGLKLESEIERIQFLTPDLARLDGRSRIVSPRGPGSEFTRFTALAVKRDADWRFAELREHGESLHNVKPAERLAELEWMVGDWVDESDGSRVVVNVRWADKQSHLIRTYHVELQGEKAHSGTMFIGWDPQTQHIKSWVFDSEGGHGEGSWIRTTENQWIVKASGVLLDGRSTSATHVHTIVNKDVVKTSSIDRVIGGHVAPDILDVVMVRKPPQPTGGAAAPASAK